MNDLSVKFLDDVGGSPMIAIMRGGDIVVAVELTLPALLMLAGQSMSALERRGHFSDSILPEALARAARIRLH
jgi:hypothetical protein